MAVMTPMERVEKLRAATADTEWSSLLASEFWQEERGYSWVVFEPGEDDPPVAEVSTLEIGKHIARWDPEAAGKVLDLLALALAPHDSSPLADCNSPLCVASLAVLDALDGGGEQR